MPLGEQFLSWSMAFQALAKEESDVTVAAAERERLRVDIAEWAVRRAFDQSRRLIVEDEPGLWSEGAYRPWGRY